MRISAGAKCRVISDNLGNFKAGDIVITLERSHVPYCCLLEDYKSDTPLCYYDVNKYYPLKSCELEVLDDRTEK